MKDVIYTPSQKANVNDSYGVRSTTVCDVRVELENGMILTLPIRARLTTDKDTQERSVSIEPTTRIKVYGDTVLQFANEQAELAFRKEILKRAQVWISYASLEAKAIERLTTEKVDSVDSGKLVRKLPPKDANNLTLPTSVSTVKVDAPAAPAAK